jgi:hypothetical protein
MAGIIKIIVITITVIFFQTQRAAQDSAEFSKRAWWLQLYSASASPRYATEKRLDNDDNNNMILFYVILFE